MNYLWGGMLLVGILYGAFTGNLNEVTDAVINSSREAVSLCITVAGVTALWCGIMKIAENTGLIASLTRKLKPILRFLFPSMPEDHPAGGLIATNMIANVLGLGWAATPAGLKAMEALEDLEDARRAGRAAGPVRKKGIASNEMCTFLIINISSLQLIPVNVIAYRSQYGSVNPTAIVGPGIVATAVSTAAAVIFCKLADRKHRSHY
ncbi:MAG TPA: nucleoside recognition protein [Candidatus Scatomonas merdavium]|nr:nucleoside recognition protein [Candidatus Scatomonas merdavium]